MRNSFFSLILYFYIYIGNNLQNQPEDVRNMFLKLFLKITCFWKYTALNY